MPLGWDALGIVAVVGKEATRFMRRNEVYYAVSFTCAGCISQYHPADERIASITQSSLSSQQAAAGRSSPRNALDCHRLSNGNDQVVLKLGADYTINYHHSIH